MTMSQDSSKMEFVYNATIDGKGVNMTDFLLRDYASKKEYTMHRYYMYV